MTPAVRVLLVEDDPGVAASVEEGLRAAGFVVDAVTTGAAALAALAEGAGPDVVVLDLGLPDADGQDVCRTIRVTSSVPVVVVSARGDEVDRVLALEFGADDYLVKPFGLRELVARIRAVLRRAGPASDPPLAGATASAGSTRPVGEASSAPQVIGRLTVDRRAQRVLLDGEEIRLTAKEFDLLAYLCEDPGAVRRRAEILENVWDAHWYGPTKTVDAHVAAIRKKLGSAAWIEAVRGVGFRMGAP